MIPVLKTFVPRLLIFLLIHLMMISTDTADVYIEHEVSVQEAEKAARRLHPEQMTDKPGCEECTWSELRYCLSYRVLHDHCCCDMKYKEWFPYVPHVCYLEEDYCKTIVSNCEEYARIRTCCCDQHTTRKWKHLLSSGNPVTPSIPVFVVVILNIIYHAILIS